MKEVRRLSLRVLRDHEIRSLYVDFRNRPSEHESLIEVTISVCTSRQFASRAASRNLQLLC